METVILQSHLKGIISIFFKAKSHFYCFTNRQWDKVEGTYTHMRTHTAFDALKILRTFFGLFLFFNQQLKKKNAVNLLDFTS